MKRTLTVNLNGMVFNIDDDAYALLDKYLKDIENHLADDESRDEIISDIEARIAELFSDRMKSSRDTVKDVITADYVNAVIATMGNPNQFAGDEAEASGNPADGTKEDRKGKKASHRLYRDPENAMLSGVLAGLAAYFGMDRTVIRLIYVALAAVGIPAGFGWFMIIAYFVIWIIAPKALTVTQRLEMRGEDVTVENIKSGFEDAKNFVQSDEFKSNAQSIGARLGEVIVVILKIAGTFFGIIFGIAGFAVVVALIAGIVALIANPWMSVNIFDIFGISGLSGLSYEYGIMLLVALLLVVGCPVFSIIYWLTRILSKKRAKSNMPFWVSLILWLAGIFMLINVGVNASFFESANRKTPWTEEFDNFYLNGSASVTDTLNQARFENINISGAVSAVLVHDSVSRVIVTAPANIRRHLHVKTENNKLRIYSGSTRILTNPNSRYYKVIIHSANFKDINIAGASKVTVGDTVRVPRLKFYIAGASVADIKARTETFEAEVVGASHLILAGSAAAADFEAAGASKINAGSFAVSSLKVEAFGASSASACASQKAEAEASGTSNIKITGNPAVRKQETSGFGKVVFE